VNESVNARRSVSHPPISVQTNARPSLFAGGENYFWQPGTEQCRQISAASTAQQTRSIVHEREPRRRLRESSGLLCVLPPNRFAVAGKLP
jgi:hypothetical protein